MAKQEIVRFGTTAQHSTFTGAAREATFDTDKNTLVCHDGSTAGGFPLLKANGDTLTNATITGSTINSSTIGATVPSTGAFTALSASTSPAAGTDVGNRNYNDARYQAIDAFLTSIAALGTASDKMIYTTGVDTAAETALTAAARSVLDDASVSDMRTTLGVAIGTDVQAYDAFLTSIAALGTAADKMIYTTGIDTAAEATITAAGRAILDDATASDQRTTLGLAIGTDVQAHDAFLDSIATLGTAADKMIYTTALNTAAEADITAAGRALLDDANAADQRTTLGLGTSAVVDTGTSGTKVALTDGANTWSALQTCSVGVVNTIGSKTASYVLADDTATSLTPLMINGHISFAVRNQTTNITSGLVRFGTAAGGAYTTIVSAGASVAVTTGALTGTTHTDTFLNISAHTDGKVYIENRRGGSVTVDISIY